MPKQQCWLVKTEPTSFSIQDLAKCPKQTTSWDGVRNYQARNFMRQMQVGDEMLFYHSSADPPSVVGIVRVVRQAYPDTTAQDAKDHHYDPKASRDNPIWEMVDLKLVEIFAEPLPLERLRDVPALKSMELLKRGSRLSVQVVDPKEFATIVRMAHAKGK